MRIDPKPAPTLVDEVAAAIDRELLGSIDRAVVDKAARAALLVLLDHWRLHDPCDIVLDGDGTIDSGGGPVCARHGCRKGTCPIDTFEARHGLQ